MAVSKDWNIGYYKTDYESEEHWQLRRTFMETHKSDIPEDELVCLAQVFTNVEFLGCKYPDATMRRVALLSVDVAKEFRKARANKIKRTFVGAGSAAEAKVKARSGSSTITTKPAIPFVSASSLDTQITATTSQNIQQNTNKRKFDSSELNSIHQTSTEKYPKTDYNYSSYKDFSNLFANVYNNFIIYEPISHGSTTGEDTKSFQILQNSAAKQKISFNIDYAERKNNSILCTVQINGVQVTGGVGDTKKLARTKATDLALDVMRKCCFTIKMMPEKLKTINVETTVKSSSSAEIESVPSEDCKLSETNIGFKMMKMLGWTGGALSEGGITEPINVQLKVNRHGLGLSPTDHPSMLDKQFKQKFYAYFRNYISDKDNVYELVFSKDFNKEERAMLHTISRQFNLKSKSKNTPDGERYLIVSKKISFIDLANNLLNNGIYSDLYDLIYPSDQRK